MKRFGTLLALTAITSILGTSAAFPAFASAKAITSVNISVGMEDMESGNVLPSEDAFSNDSTTGNYVYTNNDRYEISDMEWLTSDNKEMSIGYEPRMRVTIHATDSYYYAFRGGYQASNVSIRGGSFVSASRDGDDFLKVTLRFKPIKGTYNAPDDASWKDSSYGQARWSQVEYSSNAYDVYLYRENTVIKKLEGLRATAYNFYPYMTREGSYSFKVRTVPYTDSEKRYGKKSDWTESDEIYIPKEKVSDGSGQDNGSPGSPGFPGYPGTSGSSGSGTPGAVGWIKDSNAWYYRYPDGTYQKNGWSRVNGRWYLFDKNGIMLTGWQQRNNLWYYLNPSTQSGVEGAMTTGWLMSGSKWYYLNPSTTSGVEGAMVTGWINYNNKWYYTDPSGVMMEGWNKVDGNWYYFYPGEGSKAVSTTISGFPVDASGIWHKGQ